MILIENIDRYCRKHKLTRQKFEKQCQIGNGIVAKWANGTRGATLKTVDKIERGTGIPAATWLKKDGIR